MELKHEEKSICLADRVAVLIMDQLEINGISYKGTLYYYFNVDTEGNIYNIRSRGFPDEKGIKKLVAKAVEKINFEVGLYNDKPVDVVYYTKLVFE